MIVNELDDRFIEIENRVKALANQNKSLKARVRELDLEITRLRREAQQVEHIQGKKLLIREKLENILQTLENVKNRE